MVRNAIFEIDLEKSQIMFLQCGILDGFFAPHKEYDHNQSIKSFVDSVIYPPDAQRVYDKLCYENYLELQQHGQGNMVVEFKAKLEKMEDYQWISITVMLPTGSNKAFGSIQDIHSRKIEELDIQYKASHDSLTDLLNKTAFERQIDDIVANTTSIGWVFCVIDIDNFNALNQDYGRSFGEKVLVDIAGAVVSVLPSGSLSSRSTSDEFGLFIPNVFNSRQAEKIAVDILNSIRALSINKYGVSVSMGISLFPEHGTTFKNGFSECAFEALNDVKSLGKGSHLIYNKKQDKSHLGTVYNGVNSNHKKNSFKKYINKNGTFLLPIIGVMSVAMLVITSLVGEYMYGFNKFLLAHQNSMMDKNSEYYNLMSLSLLISIVLLITVIVLTVVIQFNRKKLLDLTFIDKVTEGRSKAKFESEIMQSLKQTKQGNTIIYANIEQFKLINDQIGREAADGILKKIYNTIEEDMGERETVSRLMADHFGIFLNTQNVTLLQQRIEYWNKEINSRCQTGDSMYNISMSYGVYLIDEPDRDISILLDRANLARRTAPKGVKFIVYDDRLKQKMQLEKEFEDKQESALEKGEFYMYLQPKYELINETIAGAEALVRWIIPDKGMVFPDQFIPLFESNGFISKIDLYMFEEVCKFIVNVENKGLKPVPISVNLSRVHLNKENFLTEYLDIWLKYGINPDLIEFEITENLIFDNVYKLIKIINDIHKYGFRVSMDDFGSGYSSLNMLKDIALDTIKLDKKFFGKTNTDVFRSTTVVKHVIDLAKDLDMTVVAEGVEKAEQVEYLREFGCELVQGYYYAKPQPAEDVLAMLVIQSNK